MLEITYQTLTLYHTASPYLSTVQAQLSSLYTQALPLMSPLLDRVAIFTHDSPAIVSVAILLLVLILAMKLLGFVQRLVMWWVRMVVRLTVLCVVVVLVSVVWQRGVGRTAEDLAGWLSELGEVWWREYRRWEGYQRESQMRGGGSNGSGKSAWR